MKKNNAKKEGVYRIRTDGIFVSTGLLSDARLIPNLKWKFTNQALDHCAKHPFVLKVAGSVAI